MVKEYLYDSSEMKQCTCILMHIENHQYEALYQLKFEKVIWERNSDEKGGNMPYYYNKYNAYWKNDIESQNVLGKEPQIYIHQ